MSECDRVFQGFPVPMQGIRENLARAIGDRVNHARGCFLLTSFYEGRTCPLRCKVLLECFFSSSHRVLKQFRRMIRHKNSWPLYLFAAVGLSLLFWWPLWTGGGLIGGDIYTYFLPQKTFFAEQLHAGEFPLWNNRVGHGYPLVGESQTAAFYPPNLILYGLFDVNTAYNLSFVLHYIAAFLFAVCYARRLDLSPIAAMLAAIIYVYGWFPPRVSLEWAIIGGTWFAAALWCTESFFCSRRWRYAIGLSSVLGIQLLAGHYNLAFITQLVLVFYVSLRLTFARHSLPVETVEIRRTIVTVLAVAMLLGFAIAAVQLLPTWTLKQQSQRAALGGVFDPGYGFIPPLYLSQIFAPWLWYDPRIIDANKALGALKMLSISSVTNRIEAHLYFGLLPVGLILWSFFARRHAKEKLDSRLKLWIILGLAALIYTTGWLLVLTRHFPGFSFFMGPGRYGIVTTLAVALLAGLAFEGILKRLHLAGKICVPILVFTLTIFDLWYVSRLVHDAEMLSDPPIHHLAESEVRTILGKCETPVRLFAPGPNLANLLGVASTPPYLGIGPSAYFDPNLTMPEPPISSETATLQQATQAEVRWLQRAGVTHILSFKPLDKRDWPVTLLWDRPDRFLNQAWARGHSEPIYLYRLEGTRGRVAFENPENKQAAITEYHANRVIIEAESSQGGRLILTDLMYSGWQVTVDGEPGNAFTVEGVFRGVDLPAGKHTVVWTYRSPSVFWGGIISVLAIAILAGIAHLCYWHPAKMGFLGKSDGAIPNPR